jgi:hypothetical protein
VAPFIGIKAADFSVLVNYVSIAKTKTSTCVVSVTHVGSAFVLCNRRSLKMGDFNFSFPSEFEEFLDSFSNAES